jgi:GNAT superfamily N-acetyltransferase
MHDRRDELLSVYAEVYAAELDDPFFSVARYWERLNAYGSRDGFGLVLGHIDAVLIGYALGYTLPNGSGWWNGLRSNVPADQLTETGTRTFALNEIMVRAPWRRQGHARALHDALLDGRREERDAPGRGGQRPRPHGLPRLGLAAARRPPAVR